VKLAGQAVRTVAKPRSEISEDLREVEGCVGFEDWVLHSKFFVGAGVKDVSGTTV
jgi:hypothetical protein